MNVVNLYHILLAVEAVLLIVVFLLSTAHLSRLKRRRFLYVAAGALLLLVFSLPDAAGYFISLPQNIKEFARIAVTLGIFLWMLVSTHADRRMGTRIAILVFIITFIVICVYIMAGRLANPGRFSYLSTLNYFDMCLVVYALIYMAAARRAGNHYFFQAFIFYGIGQALSIYSVLMRNGICISGELQPLTVDLISSTARIFGLISILLYTDAAASATLKIEVIKRELKAGISTAVSEAMAKIRASDGDEANRAKMMSSGLSAIAEALRVNLGCTMIFYGVRIDKSEDFSFTDLLGTESYGQMLKSMKLPDMAVAALQDKKRPTLVLDAVSDPMIRDPYFELIGMKSFVIIPVFSEEKLIGIMLIGAGEAGAPFSYDLSVLPLLASNISLLVSFIELRRDAVAAPETDAVSLLRNFSSFQKLLSDSIDDADRNGSQMVLIFFDVDHFSNVNEKLGFERGDQLLRDLGVILSEYAAPGYTGRVGADEFAQILPGAGEDARAKLEEELPQITSRIKQMYSDANITISVAFSIYPFDFFEKTGVFSKMREMLAAGRTATSRIVRVKVG